MAPNSAPAALPVSSATEIQESFNPPAFISGISETLRSILSHCRPWPELLDRSAFSKPETFSEAALRFRKNYNYFRVNYLAVIAAVIVISLLTNPLSLFLLAGLLASWIFLYLLREPSDPPITLFGRPFSDRERLALLIVCTIVVIFLTSVGTVLASACMAGIMIVCGHGTFRVPDALFLDQAEAQGGVSTLIGGGPASSQPSVAAGA